MRRYLDAIGDAELVRRTGRVSQLSGLGSRGPTVPGPHCISLPGLSRLYPRSASPSFSLSRLPVSHLTRDVPTRSGVQLHLARRTGSSAFRPPVKLLVYFSHPDEHQLRIAAPTTDPAIICFHRLPSRTQAHPGRRPTPACSGLATLAADTYVRPLKDHAKSQDYR